MKLFYWKERNTNVDVFATAEEVLDQEKKQELDRPFIADFWTAEIYVIEGRMLDDLKEKRPYVKMKPRAEDRIEYMRWESHTCFANDS